MPIPTTCHEIVTAAREKRKDHPLRSGGYKLKEAGDRISQLHKLLTTIADRVRAGGKFEVRSSVPMAAFW
jgi:hypothetical protein